MSKFTERPKVSHLTTIKRILRYVKWSIGCKIFFPAANTGIKCNMLGFTDSNWCKDKNGWKFTTIYIFMFVGECSKKEPVVSLSCYETEYITDSLCACQTMWLMNLLKKLCNNEGATLTLIIGNVSMINLAKNPIAHRRSKYIVIRFHYLRKLVSEGRLRLRYCRSEEQVTDF